MKKLINKLKYLYLKIKQNMFPDKKYISGECKKCGRCCKELTLFYYGLPIRNAKEFEEFYGPYPEYSIFKIKKKPFNGQPIFYCTKLSENNTCSDYENRPDICKDFPKNNSQVRYKSQLKKCGYNLNYSLNFKNTLKMESLKD